MSIKHVLAATILLSPLTHLAFAQRPTPPPTGDVAPPPIPSEGRTHVEPMPNHGREAPPSKKARPRPPVTPPTPEPTKPDPVQ